MHGANARRQKLPRMTSPAIIGTRSSRARTGCAAEHPCIRDERCGQIRSTRLAPATRMPAKNSLPDVHIHIGRVELTAVTAPRRRAPQQLRSAEQASRCALDEYLAAAQAEDAMSNALAIAGVSAVLKDLLDSGMIDHKITDAGAGCHGIRARDPT